MSENKIYNEGYRAGQHSVVDYEMKIELRDRFAEAALTGLLHRGFKEFGNSESAHAQAAYRIADAMLSERSRKPEPAPDIMEIP